MANARSIKVFEKVLSETAKRKRLIVARVSYVKNKGYRLAVDPITRTNEGTYSTETYALFSGRHETIEPATRYNAKEHERVALACQIEPLASRIQEHVRILEEKEASRGDDNAV